MNRLVWEEGETSIEYPEKKSIMVPSALDRLGLNLKIKKYTRDALGRCHNDKGHLVPCSGGSARGAKPAAGQTTFERYHQTVTQAWPDRKFPEHDKELNRRKADPSLNVKAQRTSSGSKYSTQGATLYMSRDRILSGMKWAKDNAETALVIERALKDGPLAIPNNIIASPRGIQILQEMQKAGKVQVDTKSKPGHAVLSAGTDTGKPEPKPEPKPAEKPAQGYNPIDVKAEKLSTGGMAYTLGDHARLQLSQAHGTNYRIFTGWKIGPNLHVLNVRDLFHRVIQDGPVLIPQHLFIEDPLRSAVRALELGKQAKIKADGPGGRDLLLSDINYQEPPEPGSTPGQSRPGKTPRIIPKSPVDPTDIPEYKPARNTHEAITRLKNHAKNVNYDGLPVERLNSILKATEHVIGKFGFPVHNIEFAQRGGHNYGFCISKFNGEISVQVRKSYAQDPEKYRKRDIERMTAQRQRSIERSKQFIEHLKTSQNVRGDVSGEIARQEKQIQWAENVKHWIVADAVEDPLYATQAHECWHAVYFYHNLKEKFRAEMDKGGGWDIPLTEYSRKNQAEKFAELGAAITCKMEVPPKLVEIFQNTIRSIT